MLKNSLLIGQRIGIGFAVCLAALIAIGAFSLRNLDTMQRESARVTHTVEVLAELRLLSDAHSRIEAAGRGYLLTGEPSLKAELTSQRVAAEASLRKLVALTTDNPTQGRRLARYEELLAQRVALAEELVKLREGNRTGIDERVATLVRSGQQVSIELRAVAAELSGEESRLLAERQTASARANTLTHDTVIYGSLAALLVVTIAGIVLARSITGPLAQLRAGAARIGAGDYAHRVAVTTRDEAGYLGETFNAMAAQVQQRQTLQAEQDWLKTALSNFAALFQQQHDPAMVGQMMLTQLAELLQARHSTFYRVVGDGEAVGLELCASYAALNPPARLVPGTGLVGQCFREQRRIVVQPVPPDYVRVASSLGEAAPAILVLQPVPFEGRVKAVLELAALSPFTPLQMELLARLAESLGMVLQNIEATTRTEELLRQSRQLGAQLEAQRALLAEKNATLEAQADRLRSSEQLLQEQQVELQQTNEELEQSNEEMQQTNEELEEKTHLLAQQKRELEDSNRAIEQGRLELQEKAHQLMLSSTYKSNFLATMSHELRTPLNSLLILSRILAENQDANLTPKQVQFARTIESSGADLLEMINQILDLAKIESGKVELQVSELSTAELQRSLELQFRHVAESKKLEFVVTLAAGLPADLRTDAARLHQVLKNLLSNAFKFTEHGSVAVEIRPATGGWARGNNALDRARQVVAIAVRDTGIGIPKEKQQLVFESFQQADAGTARRFGGTGLGLSISREIAHLLGGTLELQSEPGAGSTFTLFLPVSLEAAAKRLPSPAPAVPAPAATPEHPAPASPAEWEALEEASVPDDRDAIQPGDRVILVVEDDAKFAAILVDFAREKRFKALVARTARGALALAQRHQPVAITLDLRLVDEDGWLVLDRLKHDPATRHIPVHVISVEPGRNRGLRQGAVSYLQKPVSKDAIQQLLQQTVDFIDRPVKNLLVVEDDATQRESIKELIGNGDVHTTTVGHAAAALAALERERFDCVVMDLMLPDQPGVALIREMNRRLGLAAPPVIIYTGKELSPQEETELRSLSESIIVKDARSPERLLDETALFLHRVQSRLPEAKRRMLDQVRKQDAVLTGRRVLVVDDDVRNIFALTAALEGYGMNVKFAESGQEAINRIIADGNFDVVLMDIMMPGMDGNEAIRRLRADARFARLPIIAVTAKAMKGDRERSIDAGASDYITKPVDTDKLVSLLRVWLYR